MEALTDLEHEFPKHTRSSLQDTFESASALWINAMKHLHAKGHAYYESEQAANMCAFPAGASDINSPYQFMVHPKEGIPYFTHELDPKFRYEKEITSWRTEEAKENTTKRNAHLRFKRESKQREINKEKWLKKLRPFLIPKIKKGFSLESVLAECKRNGYSQTLLSDVREMWIALTKQGIKPQIIHMKLSTEASLDQEWLECMARESGSTGHTVKDFDEAMQHCTFVTYRNTGKRPSDDSFKKAKDFWHPDYWSMHESIGGLTPEDEDLAIQVGLLIQQGKTDDEIVQTVGYQFSTQPIDLYDLIRNVRKILLDIGVQKKEKAKAYYKTVETMKDLSNACVKLFGAGWSYDPDSKKCVSASDMKGHDLKKNLDIAEQIIGKLWLGDFDILEHIVKHNRVDLSDKQLLWFIQKIRKEIQGEPQPATDYHEDRRATRTLRGPLKHREPETVKGVSVVSRTTQKGVSVTKEKRRASKLKELSKADMDNLCQQQHGKTFYYDPKLNACVSTLENGEYKLQLDGPGRLDIEHPGTPPEIGHKGVGLLRGQMVHRQPETSMGSSVVSKITQKGRDVIHKKKEKKKVIKMKV